MPHISKPIVFLITALLLSGCKIATIVVEGGYVWQRDRPICQAGHICVTEVADAKFGTLFFRAHPVKGFVFDHWNAGDGFLCGGGKYYECSANLYDVTPEIAKSIVASSETLYLMPIFRRIKDIIEVDGKEWYQPNLFTGLSWNEINAVCPDGICNGMLNGHDLAGWSWASVKDMNDLFNYYIGSDLLGPGPDYADLRDAEPKFLFYEGWYLTLVDDFAGWEIIGLTKDALNTDPDFVWLAAWYEKKMYLGDFPDHAYTNGKTPKDYVSEGSLRQRGAWFYRVP